MILRTVVLLIHINPYAYIIWIVTIPIIMKPCSEVDPSTIFCGCFWTYFCYFRLRLSSIIILLQVKGGCILDVLHQRRGHISEIEKVRHMCLGTAQGLAYLHEHKCIHRDIAARNVLYTHDKVVSHSLFCVAFATFHGAFLHALMTLVISVCRNAL